MSMKGWLTSDLYQYISIHSLFRRHHTLYIIFIPVGCWVAISEFWRCKRRWGRFCGSKSANVCNIISLTCTLMFAPDINLDRRSQLFQICCFDYHKTTNITSLILFSICFLFKEIQRSTPWTQSNRFMFIIINGTTVKWIFWLPSPRLNVLLVQHLKAKHPRLFYFNNKQTGIYVEYTQKILG